MSSAPVPIPAGLTSVLRLLPTLFTLLVLAMAGAYVRPSLGEHRPASHRPPIRRVLGYLPQTETAAALESPVYVMYLVDTTDDAYDIIRMFNDAFEPGVPPAPASSWPDGATVLTLPSFRLSVLIIPGPEQESPARQLLAESAREIAAAGGSLDIIDRRASK